MSALAQSRGRTNPSRHPNYAPSQARTTMYRCANSPPSRYSLSAEPPSLHLPTRARSARRLPMPMSRSPLQIAGALFERARLFRWSSRATTIIVAVGGEGGIRPSSEIFRPPKRFSKRVIALWLAGKWMKTKDAAQPQEIMTRVSPAAAFGASFGRLSSMLAGSGRCLRDTLPRRN